MPLLTGLYELRLFLGMSGSIENFLPRLDNWYSDDINKNDELYDACDGNKQYRQYPFHGNPHVHEESTFGYRAIQYRSHDDADATRNKEVFIYYQMWVSIMRER